MAAEGSCPDCFRRGRSPTASRIIKKSTPVCIWSRGSSGTGLSDSDICGRRTITKSSRCSATGFGRGSSGFVGTCSACGDSSRMSLPTSLVWPCRRPFFRKKRRSLSRRRTTVKWYFVPGRVFLTSRQKLLVSCTARRNKNNIISFLTSLKQSNSAARLFFREFFVLDLAKAV